MHRRITQYIGKPLVELVGFNRDLDWYNDSQTVTVNFSAVFSITSAYARYTWSVSNLGSLSQTFELFRHKLKLLGLSNVFRKR